MTSAQRWLSTAVVAGLVLAWAGVAQAVVIEWVTVGDAGNLSDYTGYGAVAAEYRIGTYEITAGQYCEFLNNKAPSDPHGLYNAGMWSSYWGCKIQQTGSDGSYSYSVGADWADRPVGLVSFWDAARFANWMHNGQGNGDTETGAYTLTSEGIANNTVSREPDALFFIPTEDEWYKAAYYKSGGTNAGYWEFPTQSDTAPSNDLIDPDPGNNATFGGYTIGPPYYRTEVGAHEHSAGGYGTFDQGGNVWEWNETVSAREQRGGRGGSWGNAAFSLTASARSPFTASLERSYLGFRLASPSGPDVIPEPATVSLFGIAAAAAMLRRRRRRP